MRPPPVLAWFLVPALLLAACSPGADAPEDDRIQVVASFYPLAWAAEQVGGDRVEVIDLTPPGGEAHDATLTAEQRAQLADADLVTIHGTSGFQPEIELAATQGSAPIVQLVGDGQRTPFTTGDGGIDPHLWLDPRAMAEYVAELADELGQVDPGRAEEFRARGEALAEKLKGLFAGRDDCRYVFIVTSHEAFGYLLQRFSDGVRTAQQIGVEGSTPEGEPSAERVRTALAAIADGTAPSVVFSEPSDEGRRVAESVAADADAAVAILDPLETKPTRGDYLSVMAANDEALESWLECGP